MPKGKIKQIFYVRKRNIRLKKFLHAKKKIELNISCMQRNMEDQN